MQAQRNVANILIANSVATALTHSNNIDSYISSMSTGEPGVISPSGIVVNAAGTLPSEFKIVTKLTNGDLNISDIIKAKSIKSINTTRYTAATNQTDYVGYNGSTGSINVINSNIYSVKLHLIPSDTAGFMQQKIKEGFYESDASATQAEIAYGLTNSLIKNFSREPEKIKYSVDRIKFERINSGAQADALGTATATLNYGSKSVVFSEDMTALVTGASRGIGAAISRMLLEKGYNVIGIARNFDNCEISNSCFTKIECDLSNLAKVESVISNLKDTEINLLINNAGLAYFSYHEELNRKKIEYMTQVNLTSIMLICQLLLRKMKKVSGHIINISSVTALSPSPYAACYGALKAALSAFSHSIFEEGRKSGLKVTVIYPDITDTSFYDNAFFSVSKNKQAFLSPQDVSQCVKNIIENNENCLVSDLVIKPQLHEIGKISKVSNK